jgi:hypothetical protein
MKRTLLGGLVLAIALFIGHASVAQAAGQNIVYDGFCDGANLTYDIFTGLAAGNRTGTCLSSSGSMVGTVSQIYSQGPALTMGYGPDDLDGAYSQGLIAVIRADHTWSYYQNSGAGLVVFSSGTWSPGNALRPNRRGGISTTAAR